MSGSVFHQDRVVHVEHVWNTAVSITIVGTQERTDVARAAITECAQLFAAVDRTFSTYQPQTEVSFYRNGLAWQGGHSPEFATVLRACEDLRDVTHGTFDPWAVPGGFDPSGFVKGWAAGRAIDVLASHGLTDALVNAGGDVCAAGDEVPGSGGGWPVGIVNPHAPAEVIEVVRLHDSAMATSGRYQRGDHVIDPATGRPATGVDSATVVGPDAGVADALASAAMVQGRQCMAWFAGLGSAWSLHLVMGDSAFTYGAAFES